MLDDPLTEIVNSAPRGASHLDDLRRFAQELSLTPGSTTGGRHNVGSKHYSGNAMDIAGSGAFDDATVQRIAEAAKGQGLRLRDERVRPPKQKVWGGPHVHVEYAGGVEQDPLSEITNDPSAPTDPLAEITAGPQASRPLSAPTTLTHKSSGRFELTPKEKARLAGGVALPRVRSGVPTMADVLSEAKSTPYTPTTRDQISKQVNAEESSLVGNLKHGLDLFSRPQDVLKSREQIINEEIDRRVAAHERSGTPEMITARKRIGSVPGEVPLVPGMPSPRGAAAALQGFAGSLLQSLAGVVNMGGYSPSIKARMMGDYLQRSGQILEESASMPLNEQGQEIERSLPEKATSAVTSLGLTVAQLALLKKATGWPLGRIMAVETALRTSDMPAADRTVEIAKAYGMGRILDQHLSRPASAALFGGPTAIQTGTAYLQGKMPLADALLETGVQAGAGAIMGGKRGVPEKPATQIDAMPDVSNIPVSKIPPAEVIAPQSAMSDLPSVSPQREAATPKTVSTPSEVAGVPSTLEASEANVLGGARSRQQGEATEAQTLQMVNTLKWGRGLASQLSEADAQTVIDKGIDFNAWSSAKAMARVHGYPVEDTSRVAIDYLSGKLSEMPNAGSSTDPYRTGRAAPEVSETKPREASVAPTSESSFALPVASTVQERAPQFAVLRESATTGERHALDLTGDLNAGIARVSALKQQGVNVLDSVNADKSLTPYQRQVTHLLDHDPEIVGRVLDNYLKSAELIGSPQEKAFFEKSPPTKEALLEAAMREVVRDVNKEISVSESEGLRSEPEASRSVPNIDQASKPVSEGVPRPDRSIETGSPAEANEGIAQNLGPGAANIHEPFPEVKERSFGKQLMDDERLVEDLKESLGTSRYYEPIPNNLTAENAREFVDSRGIPEAMKAIRDESNGMPFHVRSASGQIVILRLNEAITNLKDVNPEAARLALDQATEMSEWAMDYGTRLGQGVQSFAMWAKLLPEGKLLSFKRSVEKARAEHAAAANGEVAEIIETVNREGLTHEERVAELTKLFGKNKTARLVKSELEKLVSAAEGRKLTDQKFYEITAERLGLPKYTPDIASRIMDLANAIKDAPEGIPKDRAIFALNKFIAEQKGFGPEDIPYGIYYGNILSGYNTHIVNTVDTALNVISEINGLAMNDPRAAAKIYTGLLRGLNEGRLDALMVLTEGRMVTDGKWLEVPRLMEIAQFGKQGGVPIRTNTRTARAAKAITESKIAYPLNAYKYVTRMLAASDSVFFRSAKEARASLLAYRMAEADGLKGDAIDTRAREILALDRQADFLAQAKHEGFTGSEAQTRAIELRDFVRNKDINSDSADFAGEATYNHDPHGLLGMFSSGLSRWSDTFKPLKLFVPFTRIVANVTNRGLNYTPWGYKRAAFGYTLGEGLSPEARRLMITRATVGTAGLVTLGAMQYGGLLQIHGNGPSDSERRRQLMSAGWKPYSIQMGNVYISYLNSPLGLGLSVLGNMTDSQRYHELEQKDAATRGAYAVARIGSTIFSQSFLAGLSRLFEALSNDPSESVNAVKQVMSGTVAAMTTPNLVRDGYKLFDNKQYQANTFTEDLVRNTPFAALTLRPSLNAFGEPVTLPRQRFVDIASSDPAWRFVIARGLRVPVPGRTTELKPGKRLTAEQYYSLLQTTGPQLKQWIVENQLRLSGMTEDAAQKELSKAAEKFHERALDQMEPSRLIMRSVFRGVPRPPEMASPTP